VPTRTLLDELADAGIAINPKRTKIHLAVHNGTSDPLEVFFDGNFQDWQANQGQLNFECDKIISLIKMPRNRWLFAGVYLPQSHGVEARTGRIIYVTELEAASAYLIGRVILRFRRKGQQSYRWLNMFPPALDVDEVRAVALTRDESRSRTSNPELPRLDTWASASLQALVQHVFDCRGAPLATLTYEELAELIGRRKKNGQPWARGMGKVLGRLGRVLKRIGERWQRTIPQIQGIVVQKSGPSRGLPDKGIEEFWPGYSNLTRAAKGDKVRIELERVESFGSHWNDVLEQLDLPSIVDETGNKVSGNPRFGRGGESPEHKALKAYVHDNPSIVGARKDSRATVEFPLPSCDEIDVLFEHDQECVAVEVKASVSDRVAGDYERGVYQAIKYLALLRAMSLDRKRKVCGNIRSVLVLQGSVPAEIRRLAKVLAVEVISNVKPSERYLRQAKQ